MKNRSKDVQSLQNVVASLFKDAEPWFTECEREKRKRQRER